MTWAKSSHNYLWLYGFRIFSTPVKDTFQLSLTVLVRYRSRVIFRIGSYCLPHSRSISKERYSGYSVMAFQPSPTGLSPCIALLSSRLRVSWLSQTQVQTSHPPFLSEGVRFVLFPFQSPLLRESRLLSFPADTKMFQFSASAIVTDHLKKRWEVPLKNPGFKGCMRLPLALFSLPNSSSLPEPSHPPYSVLDPTSRSDSPMKSSRDSFGVHILIPAEAVGLPIWANAR